MALSTSADSQNWSGYRLLRIRGAGGFGRVWEAEAPNKDLVAFKTIQCRNGLGLHELRNVQNVCSLKHPNLIRIDKVWCEDRYLVVVMELADGSLQDLLDISVSEFGQPLSANAIIDFLRQAAQGLDFLNERRHVINGRRVGVQHRDVKPSNLLMVGNSLKLCDFGVAAMKTSPMGLHDPAGTTAYAAPEVFRGELSDRTDQYALGVTYCHLRGCRPFADSPASFRRDYVRPTPDLSALEPAERPIVARALAAVPQDRWDRCEDMVRALVREVPCVGICDLSERRGGDRRPCPHAPRFRIVTENSPTGIAAVVVDVSKHGIGLSLDRPVGVGMELAIVVPRRGADPQSISARVVRSLRNADGKWCVGCRFAEPLTLRLLEIISTPARNEAEFRPGHRGAGAVSGG